MWELNPEQPLRAVGREEGEKNKRSRGALLVLACKSQKFPGNLENSADAVIGEL